MLSRNLARSVLLVVIGITTAHDALSDGGLGATSTEDMIAVVRNKSKSQDRRRRFFLQMRLSDTAALLGGFTVTARSSWAFVS